MGIKIIDDSSLKSVANAIRTKTGTSGALEYPDDFVSAIASISNSYEVSDEGKVVSNGALVSQTAHAEVTANGTIDTTLNNSVTVNVPTSGGSTTTSAQCKAVNFIDSYDGTIAYSYTAQEFAALTALPANPSHAGMTAQGWNMPSTWTLADAKTYVAANGKADWGQMYTTDDGKTRVYIHLEEGRTSPMLGCCPNGTVDVDWGDGTTHDTLTGTSVTTVKWTSTHSYAATGDYIIKLTVTGSMGLYGSSISGQYSGLLRYSSSTDTRNYAYRNAIRRVEIGNNVTSIGNHAFRICSGLMFLTIPSSITSIGTYAFYECYGLTSVTIPSGVTSIGDYAFSECYSLAFVTIPNSVTSIGDYAFSECYGLTSVTIPSDVTSIGNDAFSYCYGWISVTIPSDVTSIGSNAFSHSYSLAVLHFKPTNPPTVSNSYAFYDIPIDCKIYVPTGSLSAYTSATNYPSSSIYTYVEE